MSLVNLAALPIAMHLAVHTFHDLDTSPFDVKEYSLLKFGSNRVAKKFGYDMADFFFTHHYEILVENKCVVIPAPSTTVPVAATLLSHHFMNRLNSLLAREDRDPVEWTLVHRNMTYNNNYADLPKEERKKLLAADSIYINKDFVEDKFLIFIDDCTITGTHEEKISEFLANEGLPNDHAFVCFAKYIGDDPSIEMRLNHCHVKDARDLVKLSWEPDHSITTRSLRLLLEYPHSQLNALLKTAPPRFIEDSYHAAITKGYHSYPGYIDNFNLLAKHMGMARPVEMMR